MIPTYICLSARMRGKLVLTIEEPHLQPLAGLHVRDIVWLAAVIRKVKPMATLVVPLDAKEWFQRFCKQMGIISFEDEPSPSPSHQVILTICPDKEASKLRRISRDLRSLFDEAIKSPIISPREKRIRREFRKTMTVFEGAMFGYPECCVEFHAKESPSSRARVYEEFLESGMDQSIPIEFWAVAHAPCSSICQETRRLGREYLHTVAELSESLRNHVVSRLLLPRFYQTGGGRFIDLQPLDYEQHQGEVAISKEQFERDAQSRLPEPMEIVLCEVPRPFVLVDGPEEPPYKTLFPNPEMIGTMWLAYTPGLGAYMVNAKTGQLALYIASTQWIPKVGEEWRSKANFRIYRSR